MDFDGVWTQAKLDMLSLLHQHEGASSWELGLISGDEPRRIKAYMREFERMGIGEFTIQDGMYHFWLSPFGRALAESMEN